MPVSVLQPPGCQRAPTTRAPTPPTESSTMEAESLTALEMKAPLTFMCTNTVSFWVKIYLRYIHLRLWPVLGVRAFRRMSDGVSKVHHQWDHLPLGKAWVWLQVQVFFTMFQNETLSFQIICLWLLPPRWLQNNNNNTHNNINNKDNNNQCNNHNCNYSRWYVSQYPCKKSKKLIT